MFSVRFEGGDELAHALEGLSRRLSRAIVVDALLDGAQPIQEMAARRAPRAPGQPDVADHIGSKALNKRAGDGPKTFSVGIGVPTAFWYDLFPEFGTVRMGPSPYWRPAFDTEVPAALGIIGAAMWTALAARGIGRTVSQPTPVQAPGGGGLL